MMKQKNESLTKDIKTAIAIILAVLAVISFVKTENDELRADMREDIQNLRAQDAKAATKEDLQNLRAELRAQDAKAATKEDLQDLRAELRANMREIRADMREMREDMREFRDLFMKHISGHTHSSETGAVNLNKDNRQNPSPEATNPPDSDHPSHFSVGANL